MRKFLKLTTKKIKIFQDLRGSPPPPPRSGYPSVTVGDGAFMMSVTVGDGPFMMCVTVNDCLFIVSVTSVTTRC